jgi:hypothetical protein
MKKTAIALTTLTLITTAATVWAAGPMKAGLWEMTTKSDAMKSMPKMSPEQMEQMKKMGVNMPQMKEGGMVVKVCISKEMAERDQPPMGQNESGCESKNFKRQGNGYSVDIVCDNAHMKGTGTVKGTYTSGESFTSVNDFKGTAQGRPVNSHTESSGKWLGASCGDVKPMGSMMKK